MTVNPPGEVLKAATAQQSQLEPLAELVHKSNFAITFNFDDIVDEAVIAFADTVADSVRPVN